MEQRQKQPTNKGSAEWFTGEVWSTRLLKGIRPSKLNIGAVYFTPGAPTAWHSHEGGQTFYVTEGRGLVRIPRRTGCRDPTRRRHLHAHR